MTYFRKRADRQNISVLRSDLEFVASITVNGTWPPRKNELKTSHIRWGKCRANALAETDPDHTKLDHGNGILTVF